MTHTYLFNSGSASNFDDLILCSTKRDDEMLHEMQVAPAPFSAYSF